MPAFSFDVTTPAPTPDAVSGSVQALNGFPRFTGHNDFDVDDKKYLEGLAACGIAVIAIALFLLLAYHIFLLARCCCTRCQLTEEDVKKNHERCTPNQQRFLLFLWFLLTLVMMCCSYVGRNDFLAGAENVASAAGDMGDIFNQLSTHGDTLSTSASSMDATASDITCVVDDIDFSQYTSAFATAVDALASIWDGLDEKFYRVQDLIEGDAPFYIDVGVLVTVLLVALVSIAAILADFCSCCCASISRMSWILFNFASFLGVLVCLILTILVALELTISVGISDFCAAGPDLSFKNIATEKLNLDGENFDLISYYISCEGANPLFENMNSSIVELEGLNATVNAALEAGACSPTADVRSLGSGSVSCLGTLDDIQGTIGCTSINPVYQTLVYDLLCGDVVDGLYALWTVQITSAFMLYIGLFLISYTKEKVLLQLDVTKHEKDEDLRQV